VPTVVHIENVGVLAPYDVEQATLTAAAVDLRVVTCAKERELAHQAADADVLWLEWPPR
jgi:hypothetical protein